VREIQPLADQDGRVHPVVDARDALQCWVDPQQIVSEPVVRVADVDEMNGRRVQPVDHGAPMPGAVLVRAQHLAVLA
jgi:hypothetical protein